MADCVSCGKAVPAGKLFCDDCYAKMKGNESTLKRVARPVEQKPASMADEPSAIEGGTRQAEGSEPVAPAGMPEGVKTASGSLTPTSVKKVVSIKPDVEKVAKEKGKGGKKKFTVTITFSERTYTALARLKRKKKEGTPATPTEPAKQNVPDEASDAVAPIIKMKGRKRKTGPHGRPLLKAVGGKTTPGGQPKSLYERTLGYRARQWDKRDKVAAIIATFAVVMAIILLFLGWVKFTWIESEGSVPTTINIKGINLGLVAYIMVAMAFLAWLYMALTWLIKRPLLNLDFGAVLLIAGILLIIITFITLSSNGLMVQTAGNILKKGAGFKNTIAGYEKQSLWPAYVMVLAYCLLAFSGLIRLSERKG